MQQTELKNLGNPGKIEGNVKECLWKHAKIKVKFFLVLKVATDVQIAKKVKYLTRQVLGVFRNLMSANVGNYTRIMVNVKMTQPKIAVMKSSKSETPRIQRDVKQESAVLNINMAWKMIASDARNVPKAISRIQKTSRNACAKKFQDLAHSTTLPRKWIKLKTVPQLKINCA